MFAAHLGKSKFIVFHSKINISWAVIACQRCKHMEFLRENKSFRGLIRNVLGTTLHLFGSVWIPKKLIFPIDLLFFRRSLISNNFANNRCHSELVMEYIWISNEKQSGPVRSGLVRSGSGPVWFRFRSSSSSRRWDARVVLKWHWSSGATLLWAKLWEYYEKTMRNLRGRRPGFVDEVFVSSGYLAAVKNHCLSNSRFQLLERPSFTEPAFGCQAQPYYEQNYEKTMRNWRGRRPTLRHPQREGCHDMSRRR